MSLFQRAHDIVAAKADKALDNAEKPDEMLDYSYNQMLEQITRVRRGLVDIAASRKQIELQETQLQHSVDHLQDQAKAALAQGREDLAREALSRKSAAQGQIDGMEEQRQQLAEEQEKLEQALAQLQEKVNHFRSQKEVLKAQYTAASAMTSVNESAAGISTSVSDSGAALERAQDKIATMQARAGALDELMALAAVYCALRTSFWLRKWFTFSCSWASACSSFTCSSASCWRCSSRPSIWPWAADFRDSASRARSSLPCARAALAWSWR